MHYASTRPRRRAQEVFVRCARLALITALASACGDDTLTAPSDTVITVVANAASVPLGSSVELTANLIKPNGVPVDDGTPVTFVCCTSSAPNAQGQGGAAAQAGASSLGAMEPAIALTSGGKATTKFLAGNRSGIAHITAISGGARVGSVQIAVGVAIVAKVTVAANPSVFSSSAGGTDITATVFDAAGNGVPGISVAFTTTGGSFPSATVTTGESGTATARLSTNRDATISVIAGTQSATTSVKVLPPPALSVSVSPQAPTAGQAATFSLTAAAASGGSPLRDLVMNFGDGQSATLTGLSGTTTVSHVYPNAGTYTVVSTLTDISGERAIATTIITVVPRPPLTISIDAPGGTNPFAGIPVVLSAVVGPTSEIARVARIEWDFGDGVTATTTGFSTNHIFTPGTRVVTATLVTSDGARFSAELTLVVRPPPA